MFYWLLSILIFSSMSAGCQSGSADRENPNGSNSGRSFAARRAPPSRSSFAPSSVLTTIKNEQEVPVSGPYIQLFARPPASQAATSVDGNAAFIIRDFIFDETALVWKNSIPLISESGATTYQLQTHRFDSLAADLNWTQAQWRIMGQQSHQAIPAQVQLISAASQGDLPLTDLQISLRLPESFALASSAASAYTLEVPSIPSAHHHGLRLEFRIAPKLPLISITEIPDAEVHQWVRVSRRLRAQSVMTLRLQNHQAHALQLPFSRRPRFRALRMMQSRRFEFYRPQNVPNMPVLGNATGCELKTHFQKWLELIPSDFILVPQASLAQREVDLEQILVHAGDEHFAAHSFSDPLHVDLMPLLIQPGQTREFVIYMVQDSQQLYPHYRGPCLAEPARLLPTLCTEICHSVVSEADERRSRLCANLSEMVGSTLPPHLQEACSSSFTGSRSTSNRNVCLSGYSLNPTAELPFSDGNDVLGSVVDISALLRQGVTVSYADLPLLSSQLERAELWAYSGQSVLKVPSTQGNNIRLEDISGTEIREITTYCPIPLGV